MTSPMSSPLDGNGVALKPCPFCGGEPRISTYETESLWSHNQVTYTKVECPDCEVSFQTEPGYDPEAIDAWNRRSPASSQTAVEPVAWMRVEVQTHPNSPSRTELTIDPVLAKMWAFNEYTKSLTPLVPLSALTAQAAALVAAEKERDEARRRRDEWRKKAEGFDEVRLALREKVGAPWPANLSRALWAGIAADEKKRADDALAEVATLKARIADAVDELGQMATRIANDGTPSQIVTDDELRDLARRLTHQEKNNGR